MAKKLAVAPDDVNLADVAKSSKMIVLSPIKIVEAEITIEGTAGLMVKAKPPALMEELDANHRNKLTAAERKAKKKDKSIVMPTKEEECEECLYMTKEATPRFGIPVSALKKCILTAGKSSGVPSTLLSQAFFVTGDIGGIIPLDGTPEWHMDERPVIVGTFNNRNPALRQRPMFDKWEITFKIRYRADLITPETLVNLYEQAGFSVGLCEYRPEKAGNLGTFRVKRSS